MKIEVAPSRGDKSHGIEIFNYSTIPFESFEIYPAELIRREKLAPCKFFVQSQSRDYIFLESFQEDPDKVIEAALYLERLYG